MERHRFTAVQFSSTRTRGAAQFACEDRKRRSLESKEYFWQEYPLTTLQSLDKSILIYSVRAIWSFCPGSHPYGSLILDLNAAAVGADCIAVVFRRCHHIARVETPFGFDTVDTAARVKQSVRHDQPAWLNSDIAGRRRPR